MKSKVELDWKSHPDNDHHKDVMEQTITSMLVLGDSLHRRTCGEYLSIQKLNRRHIHTDVLEFAEWVFKYPNVMRAEWAIYEDDSMLVLQKYFTDNLPYWWGYENTNGQDFYRLVGSDWSVCFRLSSKKPIKYDYETSWKLYGAHWFSPVVECLTSGDMEVYETDIALMKLMGYCTPTE